MSMKTITLGSNTFDYQDSGSGDTTLLLLSGWCQDHQLFKHLIPLLAQHYRVLNIDWRGHNAARSYDGDFGMDDLTADLVLFLDRLDVERLIPLSTSHGGWANIALSQQLGPLRVPKTIVVDWLMTGAFTDLLQNLQQSQRPESWQQARDALFAEWVAHTDNQDVINHVQQEMAGFDQEMWIRSCREIELAYGQFGSPLQRLEQLTPERPVMHLYSQPHSAEYDQLQREFAQRHRWFNPVKIAGASHFPTLESPDKVVMEIRSFIG